MPHGPNEAPAAPHNEHRESAPRGEQLLDAGRRTQIDQFAGQFGLADAGLAGEAAVIRTYLVQEATRILGGSGEVESKRAALLQLAVDVTAKLTKTTVERKFGTGLTGWFRETLSKPGGKLAGGLLTAAASVFTPVSIAAPAGWALGWGLMKKGFDQYRSGDGDTRIKLADASTKLRDRVERQLRTVENQAPTEAGAAQVLSTLINDVYRTEFSTLFGQLEQGTSSEPIVPLPQLRTLGARAFWILSASPMDFDWGSGGTSQAHLVSLFDGFRNFVKQPWEAGGRVFDTHATDFWRQTWGTHGLNVGTAAWNMATLAANVGAGLVGTIGADRAANWSKGNRIQFDKSWTPLVNESPQPGRLPPPLATPGRNRILPVDEVHIASPAVDAPIVEPPTQATITAEPVEASLVNDDEPVLRSAALLIPQPATETEPTTTPRSTGQAEPTADSETNSGTRESFERPSAGRRDPERETQSQLTPIARETINTIAQHRADFARQAPDEVAAVADQLWQSLESIRNGRGFPRFNARNQVWNSTFKGLTHLVVGLQTQLEQTQADPSTLANPAEGRRLINRSLWAANQLTNVLQRRDHAVAGLNADPLRAIAAALAEQARTFATHLESQSATGHPRTDTVETPIPQEEQLPRLEVYQRPPAGWRDPEREMQSQENSLVRTTIDAITRRQTELSRRTPSEVAAVTERLWQTLASVRNSRDFPRFNTRNRIWNTAFNGLTQLVAGLQVQLDQAQAASGVANPVEAQQLIDRATWTATQLTTILDRRSHADFGLNVDPLRAIATRLTVSTRAYETQLAAQPPPEEPTPTESAPNPDVPVPLTVQELAESLHLSEVAAREAIDRERRELADIENGGSQPAALLAYIRGIQRSPTTGPASRTIRREALNSLLNHGIELILHSVSTPDQHYPLRRTYFPKLTDLSKTEIDTLNQLNEPVAADQADSFAYEFANLLRAEPQPEVGATQQAITHLLEGRNTLGNPIDALSSYVVLTRTSEPLLRQAIKEQTGQTGIYNRRFLATGLERVGGFFARLGTLPDVLPEDKATMQELARQCQTASRLLSGQIDAFLTGKLRGEFSEDTPFRTLADHTNLEDFFDPTKTLPGGPFEPKLTIREVI